MLQLGQDSQRLARVSLCESYSDFQSVISRVHLCILKKTTFSALETPLTLLKNKLIWQLASPLNSWKIYLITVLISPTCDHAHYFPFWGRADAEDESNNIYSYLLRKQNRHKEKKPHRLEQKRSVKSFPCLFWGRLFLQPKHLHAVQKITSRCLCWVLIKITACLYSKKLSLKLKRVCKQSQTNATPLRYQTAETHLEIELIEVRKKLRTVPPFVTAHTFCASWDIRVS